MNTSTPYKGLHREEAVKADCRTEAQAQLNCAPLTRPLTTTSTFKIVAVARRDSDLEAFSHNPTDGSIAPLTCRSST